MQIGWFSGTLNLRRRHGRVALAADKTPGTPAAPLAVANFWPVDSVRLLFAVPPASLHGGTARIGFEMMHWPGSLLQQVVQTVQTRVLLAERDLDLAGSCFMSRTLAEVTHLTDVARTGWRVGKPTSHQPASGMVELSQCQLFWRRLPSKRLLLRD